MSRMLNSAASFMLGAATMYFFDPVSSRRRRALARDKLVRAIHEAERGLDITSRDLQHRTMGKAAALKSRFKNSKVSEQKLVARVRAALGRVVSHPHALQVIAENGAIVLKGKILSDELESALKTAGMVKGVRRVENRLEAYRDSDRVQSLQGGKRMIGPKFEVMQANWSPSTRLMLGLCGAACVAQSLRGSSSFKSINMMLGGLGSMLLARAGTNLELSRLIGTSPQHRGIDIEKTININAPISKVFDFFSDYANFPHFMRHVRRVEGDEDGRSHWLVDGPAGTSCTWDAQLSSYEPNQEIAWETLDHNGAPHHSGIIDFRDNGNDTTQVRVRLTYDPPAGYLGHMLLSMLGSDPRKLLNDDMLRVKSFFQTGKVARDAAQPLKNNRRAKSGAVSAGERVAG